MNYLIEIISVLATLITMFTAIATIISTRNKSVSNFEKNRDLKKIENDIGMGRREKKSKI
jgi:hypothetical protein